MHVVVSPKFSENEEFSDIEPFTFGDRVVQVLWFPEFILPVERTQDFE